MIDHRTDFLSRFGADCAFKVFQTLPFTQREVVVWEKQHKLPRLTCFFDDRGTGYRYSGQETPSEEWTQELLEMREMVENTAGGKFGACLANLYRDGNDTVGWHRDNDHIFGTRMVIASVSLGAERKFRLRHRTTKEKLDFVLGHGDLLIFSDEHVRDWDHCVPRTAKPVGPRINLTFRSTD